MEDNGRFSDSFFRAITLSSYHGEAMIAASRAVLGNSYSDDEYEKDFFSIFILIDEESGDIVLDGYGKFNTASERQDLGESNLRNSINAVVKTYRVSEAHSNYQLYRRDIDDISRLYYEQFLSSLSDFKTYFKIEKTTSSVDAKE